ncbi:Ribosomal protein L11 methyltransferase [Leminorella grimontii]|nr:Ribosomal protein L11 methyltransferase [Leminorella grimontii]
MPWIQLKLNTTGANAEDIGDALVESGSVSVTFQDTHDVPVFEPLPGKPACGATPTLSACMTQKPT